MRQIRTPDGIWNLPETTNTDDAAWLKPVNDALKNLKCRATHRIMLVLNNYIEVVMHTNLPPEKYRQVMHALDDYKDEPFDVAYMPLMKQYIIEHAVTIFNDSLFEEQIQERIKAYLRSGVMQHAA
ncbi:MAG TPA: hypothetical protein VIM65_18065 [Cyclobacteriaceae bacterium]